MSEEGPSSRRGMDEGMTLSILILIGLLVLGLFYAPRLLGRRSITVSHSSSQMQQARTINLLLFCYANDHDQKYPVGKSSTEVFQKLIDEKYCTDPAVFYFAMPGKTKPTGTALKPDNVCWDVTIPVTDKDSDFTPMIFATGYRMTYGPGGSAIPLKASAIRTPGLAVAYKSNSAAFIKDDGLSDHIVLNVVNPAFSAGGKTFQQLTPDGPLAP